MSTTLNEEHKYTPETDQRHLSSKDDVKEQAAQKKSHSKHSHDERAQLKEQLIKGGAIDHTKSGGGGGFEKDSAIQPPPTTTQQQQQPVIIHSQPKPRVVIHRRQPTATQVDDSTKKSENINEKGTKEDKLPHESELEVPSQSELPEAIGEAAAEGFEKIKETFGWKSSSPSASPEAEVRDDEFKPLEVEEEYEEVKSEDAFGSRRRRQDRSGSGVAETLRRTGKPEGLSQRLTRYRNKLVEVWEGEEPVIKRKLQKGLRWVKRNKMEVPLLALATLLVLWMSVSFVMWFAFPSSPIHRSGMDQFSSKPQPQQHQHPHVTHGGYRSGETKRREQHEGLMDQLKNKFDDISLKATDRLGHLKDAVKDTLFNRHVPSFEEDVEHADYDQLKEEGSAHGTLGTGSEQNMDLFELNHQTEGGPRPVLQPDEPNAPPHWHTQPTPKSQQQPVVNEQTSLSPDILPDEPAAPYHQHPDGSWGGRRQTESGQTQPSAGQQQPPQQQAQPQEHHQQQQEHQHYHQHHTQQPQPQQQPQQPHQQQGQQHSHHHHPEQLSPEQQSQLQQQQQQWQRDHQHHHHHHHHPPQQLSPEQPSWEEVNAHLPHPHGDQQQPPAPAGQPQQPTTQPQQVNPQPVQQPSIDQENLRRPDQPPQQQPQPQPPQQQPPRQQQPQQQPPPQAQPPQQQQQPQPPQQQQQQQQPPQQQPQPPIQPPQQQQPVQQPQPNQPTDSASQNAQEAERRQQEQHQRQQEEIQRQHQRQQDEMREMMRQERERIHQQQHPQEQLNQQQQPQQPQPEQQRPPHTHAQTAEGWKPAPPVPGGTVPQ